MIKRTFTSLLLAAAISGSLISPAIAAPAEAAAAAEAARAAAARAACKRGDTAACTTPTERGTVLRFAIPKGAATVDCGCLGTTTIGATHSAMACASGTATAVACGGQCPQGGEAWQLVCD